MAKKEKENKKNIEIGYIKKRPIVEEMKESYLDYAMSVIVSRALPDVRDGLKPVHRRILYSMHKMGLTSSAKHRKSAAVVGSVLAEFHPHGDMAVYDALVRMAQDFSSRYPLVNGQGNFGSLDNDPPAASRYTEAKMTKIAEEMLVDIHKETVDWTDNYDSTRKEPVVLPAKVPQLLLNGVMGIAVGMATNIPPHNLREVMDAAIFLIDHPQAVVKDLFQFIKGPDFPTGGEIYDRKAMISAYSIGEGPIVNRAKTEITEGKTGRFKIIVTEIPYGVNKANLITKMAELVKTKKLEGIKDIRDESDKEGLRIVIELKNDIQPKKILNRLFKLTDLQKTFHLNMLALTNGIQPQILSLKGILENYVQHRQKVITRQIQFDLKQAKDRVHILEGLAKALDHIDKVIETIKKSSTKEAARKNLIKNFNLSSRQAEAILEIKLQTLAGLERKKIKDELEEKNKLIKKLEDLLKHPQKILNLMKEQCKEMKDKYGDDRRTKVFARPVGELSEEEFFPQEECVIILTRGGYIKRVNPKTYRSQRRGGKGILAITTREEDVVGYFLSASTYDNLLFFTDKGRVFQTKAYEIPETSRTARGQAIVNILQLGSTEKITAILNVSRLQGTKYLSIATSSGIIKRTKIEQFEKVRKNGLIAISLKKDDRLRWAKLTSGNDEIILITAKGQSIRFKESDIRSMSRTASGVRGVHLRKDDNLVGMGIISKEEEKTSKLLIVTENGFGKKTDLKYYKLQKRGGYGIKTFKITQKTGDIVVSQILRNSGLPEDQNKEEKDLIAISQKGHALRAALKDVPSLGRVTQGVRIMRLGEKDKLVAMACI